MIQCDFEWSSQEFRHSEKPIAGGDRLAMKALGVAYKYFLCPMAEIDVNAWGNDDGYRHHIEELQHNDGDAIWIKPWLVGHWVEGKEIVLQLSPTDIIETAVKETGLAAKMHGEHKAGALLGIYLTVSRKQENWSATFAFRLAPGRDPRILHDLPVTEALCLAVEGGGAATVEAWLNQAYRGSQGAL